MTTLILASHDHQQLDPATTRLVSAARSFGHPVEILVIGTDTAADTAAVAAQAASLAGVSRVLRADLPAPHPPGAETVARLLVALKERYRVLLAAHSLLARAALPRAAALLPAAYLSDVTAIPQPDRVVRPMHAGAVLATVAVNADRLLLTVRACAFAAVDAAAAPAPIESVGPVEPDLRARLLGCETAGGSRPDLSRARVVVAGGRGVGSAERMSLVEALADRLGGAVGASRAAVDAGFAPNAMQVGQTGKVVAPEVYIAAGISGAIQHVAGIKDAGVIVAINKDPDAPIFSVADVGLVADLFEVLPALTAALPARA